MHPEDEDDSIDPQKIIGLALVGIGAMALLLITITVVQIVRNPNEANLIQWMSDSAGGDSAVLSGDFDGSKFEIQANQAFQIIFLCLVGLIILRLVTSIFMAFIKQGTALLVKAGKDEEEKKAKRANKPPKLKFPPRDS